MFTVTQRLLLNPFHSLPASSATLPTPFTPDTHQLTQPGGWREEGTPSIPHSPLPQSQREPDSASCSRCACPHPAHAGGQSWD